MRRFLALVTTAAMTLSLTQTGHGASAIVIPDRTNYTVGQFLSYSSPYNAAGTACVVGSTCGDLIRIPAVGYPNGTTASWTWPKLGCGASGGGLCGYVGQVTYGNYDSGVPKVAVTPVQVAAMHNFIEQIQLSSVTGSSSDFNILNEFYLTSVRGNAATKVAEIGFFENLSDMGQLYFASGTPCASYTDLNRHVWACRYQQGGSSGAYFMYYSGARVLSATLDFKAVINSLLSQHRLSSAGLWVNGVAVGIEPMRNSGSYTVSKFSITLN